MKVKITQGGYGYRPTLNKPPKLVCAGEVVEVDAGEAKRLVTLGTAVIIEESASSPVATPSISLSDASAGNTSARIKTPTESQSESGRITGHFDPEQFNTMTNAELKELAIGLGIDVSKCRKKADYITLLTEAEISVDESDVDVPDLTVEDPVVE